MTDVEWVHNRCSDWEKITTSYRISIWPRKCNSSKKNIWLKKAYRVRHSDYTYGGQIDHEDRWYTKEEYIMLRLKG